LAKIVVCGYMVRYPVVGLSFAYLHYVLGLQRLGHEVVYLEESGWPNSCYDPLAGQHTDDPTTGLRLARALAEHYGLRVPMCYVDRDSGAVYGSSWPDLKEALRSADLLLNLGGVCWLPEFRLCARRALVDMDPLFTQVGQFAGDSLPEHEVYFTYGVNIGQPGCSIPTGSVEWIPTVPPVVGDLWSSTDSDRHADRFTTVAHWTAYGSVTYMGERFGQKDEEFLRIADLPSRVSRPLEIAVSGIGAADSRRLLEGGWSLREAAEISARPEDYQAYLTGSLGEVSAAKNAYVKTRSGWFSDRSVCYLAAGRPVILQETGFSDWVTTGRGLLAFTTADEAAECIEAVMSNYDAHRRAAADTARRIFSYDVVLPRLVAAATRPAALARASRSGTGQGVSS
jgi:hypothetical protein